MDDFDFTPVYREEQFIDAILNGTTPPEPVFRREFYLAKAAGANVEVPEPVFRDEVYLAKAAGEDVDVPEPVTREEMYLARAAGENIDTPEPVFRDEYWLNEWAGGGGPESVEKTVSGSLITVTDALAEPAVDLVTTIVPAQSGTGDPSPDNVRPISGWTGANVTKTALNLWGGDVLAEAFRGCNGYAKDTTAKTITFNRAPTSPYHMTLCAVPFKPLTRYTLLAQYSNGGQNTSIIVEYTDGTSAQISFDNSSNVKKSRAFVTASGKTVKEFYLGYKSTSKTTIYYEESGVFEGVLTYNDFEAYSGTTYTVSFGSAGTVYGGTLDVTTGVLTIDHQMFLFDSSDTGNWTVNANNYFQRLRPTGFSETSSDAWPKKFYSNALETTTRSGSAGNIQFNSFYAGSTYLAVRIDSFNHDLTTFQNFLTNTGLQILVPIAEQTVQLTPTEVTLLLGTNNVWSDTGDTTLTYLADGRVNSLTALNMLLGGMYEPSSDVTDKEALSIIMGESE